MCVDSGAYYQISKLYGVREATDDSFQVEIHASEYLVPFFARS